MKKADLIFFLEGILLEIRRGLSCDFYLSPIVDFNNFLFQTGLRKCLPQHVWRVCSVGERRKEGWFRQHS